MQHVEATPASLVDINDAAEALGMLPALARVYLDSRCDFPVATYQGRPLWLSATVQDAIAERVAA